MGHVNAQGIIHLRAELPHAYGTVDIDWDMAGRQALFTRINEELHQHARVLGAHFVPNPEWSLLKLRHLVTAHPLGGCPLGEDIEHGTVDEFGRVFSGRGQVHEGLFVADGALIPSALGVNPFMTIAALAERIADRIVTDLGGGPAVAVPCKWD
jgi:cholesterol oxidase